MRRPNQRSTPHGEHRPVLLPEIVQLFDLKPGMTVVDCTVGWAGHSAELMRFTTAGTLFAGYRLWSGYISPDRFASAATCHPDR